MLVCITVQLSSPLETLQLAQPILPLYKQISLTALRV